MRKLVALLLVLAAACESPKQVIMLDTTVHVDTSVVIRAKDGTMCRLNIRDVRSVKKGDMVECTWN